MYSMKLAILAFALLAVVSAVSEDYTDAESSVSVLMQQGKDSSACKDLANASIKEVTEAVSQSQKISDSMDDGSNCKNEGQSALKAAQKRESNAQTNLQTTSRASEQACDASVTLEPQDLSTLSKSTCEFVKNDSGYKAAASKCKTAKSEHEKAKGAASAATKSVTDARTDAANRKKTCLCKAKDAYNKAIEAFKKVNSKADAQGWKKAHNMLCVLDGKTTCTFKGVPTVTPKPLSDDAKNVVCVVQTPAPTPAPTPEEVSKPGWDQAANTAIDYDSNGMGLFSATNTGRSCTGTCWQTIYGSVLAPATIGNTHTFMIGISRLNNLKNKDTKIVVGITTNEDNNAESAKTNGQSYAGCAISDTVETGCFGYIGGNGNFMSEPKISRSFSPASGSKVFSFGDKVTIKLDVKDDKTHATFFLLRSGRRSKVGEMSKETAKLPSNAKFRIFVSMINTSPKDAQCAVYIQ